MSEQTATVASVFGDRRGREEQNVQRRYVAIAAATPAPSTVRM